MPSALKAPNIANAAVRSPPSLEPSPDALNTTSDPFRRLLLTLGSRPCEIEVAAAIVEYDRDMSADRKEMALRVFAFKLGTCSQTRGILGKG